MNRRFIGAMLLTLMGTAFSTRQIEAKEVRIRVSRADQPFKPGARVRVWFTMQGQKSLQELEIVNGVAIGDFTVIDNLGHYNASIGHIGFFTFQLHGKTIGTATEPMRDVMSGRRLDFRL